MNSNSHNTLRLLLLSALFIAIDAVQLSALFPSNGFIPGWTTNHMSVFPDETVLLTGEMQYLPNITLHPLIQFENRIPEESGLVIITRVGAEDSNVIWAHAVRGVTFLSATLDSAGNVYLLAMAMFFGTPLQITKFSISGEPLWTKQTNDYRLPFPTAPENTFPTGVEMDFPRRLFFINPKLLLAPGRIMRDGQITPAVLHFSARSGSLLRVTPLQINFVNKLKHDSTKDFVVHSKFNSACFVQWEYFDAESKFGRLLTHCVLLDGTDTTVTRELPYSMQYDELLLTRASVDQTYSELEAPILTVTFEKLLKTYGPVSDSWQGGHQVIVHKLNLLTLEDVDWGTHEVQGKTLPAVLNLPTKILDDRTKFLKSAAVFHQDMQINSVLIQSRFKTMEFSRSDNGAFFVTGKLYNDEKKTASRVVFLNRNKIVSTVPVLAPPGSPDVSFSDVKLSSDGARVYLCGYGAPHFNGSEWNTAPFFLTSIPVPALASMPEIAVAANSLV